MLVVVVIGQYRDVQITGDLDKDAIRYCLDDRLVPATFPYPMDMVFYIILK